MRLQFILSEIGHGLRRNLSMAISVILVTFVSLTFVGAAGLLQLQVNEMKDNWYDRVEVSIFLCPIGSDVTTCADGEATQEQIDGIRAELESPANNDLVKQVYFETKDEAYSSFRERFADEWWAQGVTADQMQASFRVALVNPEQYQVVSEMFSGYTGVESVQDRRALIEPLILLAAVLLITTTIRLSAMSRRQETEIMRLVGSSNLFIQLPFMLEGAIAATLGAGLSVAGLWFAVKYLVQDWLAQSVRFVAFIGTDAVWTVAPALVAVAIGLAAVSSVVTLSRYTRV